MIEIRSDRKALCKLVKPLEQRGGSGGVTMCCHVNKGGKLIGQAKYLNWMSFKELTRDVLNDVVDEEALLWLINSKVKTCAMNEVRYQFGHKGEQGGQDG